MKLMRDRFELKLQHPFTIARGSRSTTSVVVTRLEHNGLEGYGEASPSSRYAESVETVEAFLDRVDLSQFDPFALEAIMQQLEALGEGHAAAKASIDLALHDWIGKKLGIPLYKLWGLKSDGIPLTSYTIGIDKPDVISQKVRAAEEFPILKVKLGGEHDELIMRAIREISDKQVRVDANEGWKTKETALEKIKWLEQEGVEFIEQPMPVDRVHDMEWLRARVNLPLIADENCRGLADVASLQGKFDGMNIKLMKCSGLREALRMIHAARACGLKIMLGCMIESSIAITAAAHLGSLVDYIDLDGNVLTTNDPFTGVMIEKGRMILPDRPGIGVLSRNKES